MACEHLSPFARLSSYSRFQLCTYIPVCKVCTSFPVNSLAILWQYIVISWQPSHGVHVWDVYRLFHIKCIMYIWGDVPGSLITLLYRKETIGKGQRNNSSRANGLWTWFHINPSPWHFRCSTVQDQWLKSPCIILVPFKPPAKNIYNIMMASDIESKSGNQENSTYKNYWNSVL